MDEAARKIGIKTTKTATSQEKLALLESGEKEPSYKQLTSMADAYHRPLITFYLGKPPVIEDKGGEREKSFVLSRLAEIALADGALMEPEGRMILQIAGMLDYPADRAYTIIVGAAQAGALRSDVMLNRIAAELRRSFAGDWFDPSAGPLAGEIPE